MVMLYFLNCYGVETFKWAADGFSGSFSLFKLILLFDLSKALSILDVDNPEFVHSFDFKGSSLGLVDVLPTIDL